MLAIGTTLAIPAASAVATGNDRIKHVLLISVDGMHQSDLDWYVANHPDSELARLAADDRGIHLRADHRPIRLRPGRHGHYDADPKTLGIYYDDEYSHGVFPAGTTNCSGPSRAAT